MINNLTVNFTHVAALAARLGKHIALYDLETTTFRGRANFAITELSCFFVSPEGQGAFVGSLINPKRSIDARVIELTGITPAMVADQPEWGERYARMFANMASGECWVAGFNNATFDNPAVIDMGERYGDPIKEFKYTFDVRKLHLKLSGATSTAGKLGDVARDYGVLPRGDLHRAQADVALTVELLNAIVERYGVDAVAAQIETPSTSVTSPREVRQGYAHGTLARAPAKPVLTTAMLADYARGKPFVSIQLLAQDLGHEDRTVSFAIGKAIDERAVDPWTFAVAPAQELLTQELVELDVAVLTQGRLKPIHDALAPRVPSSLLDYVQLRIAMLAAGQAWSSLRPQ